jgi:hypothetical protein
LGCLLREKEELRAYAFFVKAIRRSLTKKMRAGIIIADISSTRSGVSCFPQLSK